MLPEHYHGQGVHDSGGITGLHDGKTLLDPDFSMEEPKVILILGSFHRGQVR